LILRLAQVFESASDDLPEVLNKILVHLLELFGATAGSILLRSREGDVVPLTAVARGDELYLNREATRIAMTEGRAVLAASFFAPPSGKATRRARKSMIVPLYEQDMAFGAIHLERPEGSEYTLKDVAFMEALSRLVSGAVRQAIRIDRMGQTQDGAALAIVGQSPAMEYVREQLNRVSKTDSTVLITGETGTGKELVAGAIHAQSVRASGPFIAINCAAIPDSLIESELFGYERGAFTGADSMKRGKFEMGDSGTLFLDEIGEMHYDLQPKLLRFLQERIFYRVGGVRPIQTDVRIIAATNRDLDRAVEQGTFRNDLLYRLNVFSIEMPPLRERREDIRTIINHFTQPFAAKLGKPFLGIDDYAWIALESYAWPGNVRELLQSLERALILSDDGALRREHFQIPEPESEDDEFSTGSVATKAEKSTSGKGGGRPKPPTLADVERRAIVRALRYAGGNKRRAAEILNIHRNTLRKKIIEYGIHE
jgi:transcriptional regulator with PAS, ATPase and Fis domain